ncbi:MAG: hypothetical protein NVSMB68_03530 [Thermoanaerobaculia bacterium]
MMHVDDLAEVVLRPGDIEHAPTAGVCLRLLPGNLDGPKEVCRKAIVRCNVRDDATAKKEEWAEDERNSEQRRHGPPASRVTGTAPAKRGGPAAVLNIVTFPFKSTGP